MGMELAGAVSFSVEGINYDITAFGYALGGMKRESLFSLGPPRGHFKSSPYAGKITATIRDHGGNPLSVWLAMENVTVIAGLANGKTVTGAGLYVVDAIEVDGAEATYSVTFEGAEVFEA